MPCTVVAKIQTQNLAGYKDVITICDEAKNLHNTFNDKSSLKVTGKPLQLVVKLLNNSNTSREGTSLQFLC